MKRALFLTVLSIFSVSGALTPAQAAINPQEYLNDAGYVFDGVVSEVSVAEKTGDNGKPVKTISFTFTVSSVDRAASEVKAGDVIEVKYNEFKPVPKVRPPGWVGPQDLMTPDAPEKGQKLKVYLDVAKDKEGNTWFAPGSHQYSFEVLEEKAEAK